MRLWKPGILECWDIGLFENEPLFHYSIIPWNWYKPGAIKRSLISTNFRISETLKVVKELQIFGLCIFGADGKDFDAATFGVSKIKAPFICKYYFLDCGASFFSEHFPLFPGLMILARYFHPAQ